MPELMTAAEVAKALRVSTYTVDRLRKADKPLLAVRVGGQFRYRREDVEAFLSPSEPSESQT